MSKAIDTLVKDKTWYMTKLLRKSKGDTYAADEAYQDSAVRLLTMKPVTNNVKNYVAVVVINSLNEYYGRKSIAVPNSEAIDLVLENAGQEHKFHTTEEEDILQDVYAAISNLPPQRRKIVEEFIRLDSLVDIKVGLKYNSVKAHYRQACKQIKEKIDATN
jgi:DNA-directed RNA polymerase specialized sigma24 family protein